MLSISPTSAGDSYGSSGNNNNSSSDTYGSSGGGGYGSGGNSGDNYNSGGNSGSLVNQVKGAAEQFVGVRFYPILQMDCSTH